MTHEAISSGPEFLPTLRVERGAWRLALATVIASSVMFAVLAPFARTPLPRVDAFIPIYEAALVINDLITAVLLFGQFHILRSKALFMLAGGYLFTACMAVVHALSFPGLFAPHGLFNAGPQSTAWLYMMWHGGFPLFVIAYALFDKKEGAASWWHHRPGLTITGGSALIAAIVALLTFVTTSGHDALPQIMENSHYTPAMIWVVSTVWLLNSLALLMLWGRRPRSVLDLWLMVVMCSWLFDIALSALLNAGRFDLGFYAGRIYGLAAASFVLIVLLTENGELYARLVDTNERERRKSADLEKLSAQLEKANRHKSEFLATMSHELRTPLNAVIGFSEVLKDELIGELTPEQQEYAENIYLSGHHLLSLINDILDLSKIEAGKMNLDLAPLDVEPTLRASLSIVKEKAMQRNLDLKMVTRGALGPMAADPRKLKQILYNLLSNAVKFTPDGGHVTLRARRINRDDIAGALPQAPTHISFPLPSSGFEEFLEITVQDSGCGIAPEEAGQLFQSFSQINGGALSREVEGTGLGLVLVLKLAQLHGGAAALSSTPGEGSCFAVWLPWRTADANAAAQSDARSFNRSAAFTKHGDSHIQVQS
jgi:signal transduction histidine kinase